jgi:trehalose 6-phosphate phosphatase
VSDRHTSADVLSRRAELRDWLEGAEGLLLGLDFDGTLAPIVEDHTEATMAPDARDAVGRLAAHSGVALAVVSGRALEDLTGRVDVEGAVYAGNHGLELAHEGERTVHPDVEGIGPEIDRLCAELDDRLEDVPGYAAENKRVTATVHYRTTPEEHVPRVVGTVERVVDGVDGLRVTEGRAIREVRPAVEWDKGRVMELLAGTTPPGWRVMYVGDDTTDEDAFRAIRPDGVGVRVDPPGADGTRGTDGTAASYCLGEQAAVPRFLEWLEATAPRPDPAGGVERAAETGWPGRNPVERARRSPPDGPGP